MANKLPSSTKARGQGEILTIEDTDFDNIAKMLASSDVPETAPQFWHERFVQWWEENPYFRGSARGYWVRDAGRCVGFYGVIPHEFQLNGSTHPAYAGTTWRVLPSYGRFALPLLLRVMKLASDGPLFTWTRDDRVARTLRDLKWHSIQRPIVSRWTRTTLLYRSDHASSPLLRFTNLGVRAYCAAVERILHWKVPSQLRSCRLFELDERLDELWHRTRQISSTMPLRDARFLRWRTAAKHPGFRVYGCFDGESLCGVLVGINASPRGLRMLEIADVWFDSSVSGCDLSLVQAAVSDTKDDGFDGCVLVPWNRRISQSAQRAGFLPFPIPSSQEFVFSGSKTLPAILFETEHWGGLIGDRYL